MNQLLGMWAYSCLTRAQDCGEPALGYVGPLQLFDTGTGLVNQLWGIWARYSCLTRAHDCGEPALGYVGPPQLFDTGTGLW